MRRERNALYTSSFSGMGQISETASKKSVTPSKANGTISLVCKISQLKSNESKVPSRMLEMSTNAPNFPLETN
jgi:hypothetical protein